LPQLVTAVLVADGLDDAALAESLAAVGITWSLQVWSQLL
jgi:hypothetical protein